MSISLPVRAALTIAFLLTVTVALTGVLSLYQLRSFSNEFLRDRMALVLDEARDSMEASLSIGLPLDGLAGVDRSVEAILRSDSDILSVDFFDGNGIIHYSSDETLRGDLVSEDWVAEWDVGEDAFWILEERDAIVVGLRVRDPLGLLAGSLALRYSRAAADQRIGRMALNILYVVAAVIAVFGAVGAWLSYWLTRAARDRLVTMQRLVGGEAVDRDGAAFAESHDFARRANSIHRAIQSAKSEIRDLEEGVTALPAGKNAP